jgi:hypothetical protein
VETSKKMKEQGGDQTSGSALPELQQSFLPALEVVDSYIETAVSMSNFSE